MPCPPLWVAAATSIIIAGQPYDVGRPVVLWCDAERGFDGYAEACVEPSSLGQSVCCARPFKRYGARAGVRPGNLADVQASVHQLVLHHDGCVNSRSCFRSMHDMPRPDGGCGLSAHFMIDADGTIYQTLDVSERALHAGAVNQGSIGVEMCNRGDASRDELDRLPPDYRTRPVRTVVINQRAHQAFDFRPEQYTSVTALARVLLRALPLIRPVMPQQGGQPLLATLADPLGFRGILGHFHVDTQQRKWDPGAFDWGQLLGALHALHLPVPVRGHDRFPQDDLGRLQAVTRAALVHVEGLAGRGGGEGEGDGDGAAGGGIYPLGPGGLWDPRVSLVGAPGTVVRAPARGVMVAARRPSAGGGPSGVGFVLLRHDEDLGPAGTLRYFTRLSGLEPTGPFVSTPGVPAPGAAAAAGQVMLLQVPVEAGDPLGVLPEGRVRMELFTPAALPPGLAGSFTASDGSADGPVCARAGIYRALGVARGSAFDAAAVARFLADASAEDRQLLRRLTVRLRHPFGDHTGAEAFATAPALAGLTPLERRQLFARAVAPEIFWTEALSRHGQLPADQTVFFHHPIAFLANLAARRGRLPLRWPAAALDDGSLSPLSERGRGAMAWMARPASPSGPARLRVGPIVRPAFATRPRHEIPLVDLPDLDAGTAPGRRP